jgi:hypothetical protein
LVPDFGAVLRAARAGALRVVAGACFAVDFRVEPDVARFAGDFRAAAPLGLEEPPDFDDLPELDDPLDLDDVEADFLDAAEVFRAAGFFAALELVAERDLARPPGFLAAIYPLFMSSPAWAPVGRSWESPFRKAKGRPGGRPAEVRSVARVRRSPRLRPRPRRLPGRRLRRRPPRGCRRLHLVQVSPVSRVSRASSLLSLG